MQGGSYTAQHDRINSRADDWDEGVENRRAFKVTQRGAGADLSVDVAIGDAVVTGDDQVNQGNYDVRSDAVTNVTGYSAPGSNSRYDLVGIQVNDPNAGGAAGSNATIVRVAGTAAASPVIPAIPNSFLTLAIIGPILTSTTQITNAMIHDAHTGTGPTGVTGVRLVSGFRDRPGSSKTTYVTIADNGWLMEFGQAVSRTTYINLFEELGTTFGAGDGSTTFNLPDSRGRVHVGLDNMGGSDAGRIAASNAMGGTGGLADPTIVDHAHSIDPPNTGVAIDSSPTINGQGPILVDGAGSPTGSTYTNNLDATGGSTQIKYNSSNLVLAGGAYSVNIAAFASAGVTGVGSPTDKNLQPYILINRMIRT